MNSTSINKNLSANPTLFFEYGDRDLSFRYIVSAREGIILKEEQFKVLKTLSEATSRMDLNAFAEKVNLTSNQTINQIQELAKEGFLQRVGGGYGITQKGRSALKALSVFPSEMSFRFYFGLDKPSELTAWSLAEFYSFIKQISVESIEFHLDRGDFQNWFKDACKDPEMASELERVKAEGFKGEALRVEILKLLDGKYSLEGLI